MGLKESRDNVWTYFWKKERENKWFLVAMLLIECKFFLNKNRVFFFSSVEKAVNKIYLVTHTHKHTHTHTIAPTSP